MNCRRAAAAILITLAALFAATAPARAEPVPPHELELTAADIFRALLLHHDLQPVNPADDNFGTHGTVLVIYGRLPKDEDRVKLANFSKDLISRNGAVLIATDEAGDLSDFFPKLSTPIRIDGRIVREKNAAAGHDGDSEKPYLRFREQQMTLAPSLLVIASLKRVALHQASFITANSQLTSIGHLPTAIDFDPKKPGDNGSVFAMLSADSGRFGMVLANSGVLSNQMLAGNRSPAERQLQNFEFANYLAAHLASGPTGHIRRDKVIFWENDRYRFGNDFNRVTFQTSLPDVQPSWSMIQNAIAKGIDDKVNELQDKDWPTQSLLRRFAWREIMQKVAPVVAFIVFILCLRRFRASRNDGESVPMTVNDVDATVDDRTRSLLESGEFREVLIESLQVCFEQWGAGTGDLPAVDADAPARYRNLLEADLQRLWRVLQFPPKAVTKSQWRVLHELAARRDDEHRAGQWTFRLKASLA